MIEWLKKKHGLPDGNLFISWRKSFHSIIYSNICNWEARNKRFEK